MKIAVENNVENWNRQHKKKTPIENLLFFLYHTKAMIWLITIFY